MKTLELVSRSLLQLLLAICVAVCCLKLCTGCTTIKTEWEASKPSVVSHICERFTALMGVSTNATEEASSSVQNCEQ